MEIVLGLLGGLFFSVMVPLNFIHFDHLSTSTSLFDVYDFKRFFGIREV